MRMETALPITFTDHNFSLAGQFFRHACEGSRRRRIMPKGVGCPASRRVPSPRKLPEPSSRCGWLRPLCEKITAHMLCVTGKEAERIARALACWP